MLKVHEIIDTLRLPPQITQMAQIDADFLLKIINLCKSV